MWGLACHRQVAYGSCDILIHVTRSAKAKVAQFNPCQPCGIHLQQVTLARQLCGNKLAIDGKVECTGLWHLFCRLRATSQYC